MSGPSDAASRIFVAIDTTSMERAKELISALDGVVGGMKLGLEFFAANGPAGVSELVSGSSLPLFLDLKLHDIPNTVASAIRALAGIPRIDFLTIHASGGAAMVSAARAAIDATWPAAARPRLLAVTILTSLDDASLSEIGFAHSSAAQVQRLAALSLSAGADGIVCSGHELGPLRAAHPTAVFMVPGIRLAEPPATGGPVTVVGAGDQARVATPGAAVAAGASYIVVGRAITAAGGSSEMQAAAAAVVADVQRAIQ